jgi:hypothetical protein
VVAPNVTAAPVEFDTRTPKVTDEPTVVRGNVRVEGLAVTLPATPVPCRLTVWVVGVELSVIVRVPVLAPAADGVKVIGIVQDWPATMPKHPKVLEANAKSFPVICMVLTFKVSVAEAELVTVTLSGWL